MTKHVDWQEECSLFVCLSRNRLNGKHVFDRAELEEKRGSWQASDLVNHPSPRDAMTRVMVSAADEDKCICRHGREDRGESLSQKKGLGDGMLLMTVAPLFVSR